MTEQDRDRAELLESKRALESARIASISTDVAIAAVRHTSQEIRSIVAPNGYVERFRDLLRGA